MNPVLVYGAPEGWDAVLLARRAAEHRGPVLHVAAGETVAAGSRLDAALVPPPEAWG